MIVLATAAALTGGLTADASARAGGGGAGGGHAGGFGGGGHMGGGFGAGGHMGGGFGGGHFGGPSGLWAAAVRVSTLPGRAATSTTADVSVAACVSGPAGTGSATTTPITFPAAAICPRTDVREHQRPASRSCREKQAPTFLRGLFAV